MTIQECTINRVCKDEKNPFTVVSNKIFEYGLSNNALGLLVKMLSRPNDWKFYVSELIKTCKNGRYSINTSINELIAKGFVRRIQHRKSNGRFNGYHYSIYEVPFYQIGTIKFSKTNNTKKKKKVKYKKNDFDNQKVLDYQDKISKVIGEKIKKHGVVQLLTESNENDIELYLENWDKFKYSNKRNPVGFFIKACTFKYDIPKNGQNKPIQSLNYEQRKYDDEFFAGLYDNVQLDSMNDLNDSRSDSKEDLNIYYDNIDYL